MKSIYLLLMIGSIGIVACNQQAEPRSAPADSATIQAAIDSSVAVENNAAAAIDSTIKDAIDSTKADSTVF